MKVKITILLILISSVTLIAQNFTFGIFGGGNLNFLGVKAEDPLDKDYKVSPGLSGNLGCFMNYNKANYGVMITAETQNTIDKDNTVIETSDEFGNNMGSYEQKITNTSFVCGTMGTVKISRRAFLGAGIAGNFLLSSSLKTDRDLYYQGQSMGAAFNNHQYRFFTFSIPLVAGISFKRLDLLLRLNKGITNKIPDNISKIKETDNVVMIGLGYKFGKKKD
jgi:hypothetical protein